MCISPTTSRLDLDFPLDEGRTLVDGDIAVQATGLVGSSVRARLLSPTALSVAVCLALAASQAQAVPDFTMSVSDTSGSSFNTSGNWTPATGAPQSGFTYGTGTSTSAKTINTPFGTTSAVFQGDSLTIEGPLGILALRNTSGGSVTVNNNTTNPGGLILNGGYIITPNGANILTDINGVITVTADSILRPAGGGNVQVYNADIGGTAGLSIDSSKSVGGVVEFTSSNNTYEGNTIVGSGAILRMGAVNAMPHDAATDGDLEVQAGGTFELDGNDTSIQGLSGVSTAVVENANDDDARLTIQGSAANSSFTGTMRDGTGSGSLAVTKTGDTLQIFSGTGFSYSGGTIVDDGQLRLASGASLGSGAVTITGDGSSTLELDNTGVDYALTLEGRSSGTAHINNFAGNNTVSGILTLDETSTTPDDPAVFTIDSTADQLAVSSDIAFTGAQGAVLNLGGTSAAANTISGNINLAGTGIAGNSLEKEGVGSWTVTGTIDTDSVSVNAGALTVANTLNASDGVTVVSGGTFRQQGSIIDRVSQAGGFTNDGTIDLNGSSATVSAIAGITGTATIENATGTDVTLTVGNAAGGVYAGGIDDSPAGAGVINLGKDGAGTQTIGNINIEGSIDVTDGSLDVSAAANSGDVTVDGGAFNVAGAATADDVTVEIGSSVAFNSGAGTTDTTVISIDNDGAMTGGDNIADNLNVTTTIVNTGTLTSTGNVVVVGDVTTSGTMNIGGTLGAAALSNSGVLDVTGAATAASAEFTGGTTDLTSLDLSGGTLTVSGGTNDITDTLASGDVAVSAGSLELSGANSVGNASVTGGTLAVQSVGALNGTGDTVVNGGAVWLDGTSGALSINEKFQLVGQSGVIANAQLNNIASANTIGGAAAGVELVDGSGSEQNYSISTESGTLTIAGTGIDSNISSGTRSVTLGGVAGANTIDADDTGAGLALGGGASYKLIKEGDSEWSISGTEIANAASIETRGGTLKLTDATTITGTATAIMVAAGATLDVSQANGGSGLTLGSGQALSGNGTVNGDIIAASGAVIGAGSPTDPLSVDGNLAISDTAKLFVELSGSATDLIDATGTFTLQTGSIVEFDILSALTANVYRFARYGSLSGTFGTEIDVPDLYTISYGYEGEDVIALVRDTPIRVPVPAPLALIAVGLFGMSAARKRLR